MAASVDYRSLLTRHLPVLRYDSQEPYFADSAAEWTDNPGNQLRRGDGTILAAASPAGGEPQLSLGFLGAKAYADGSEVSRDDRIGDPARDYPTQARHLHVQPRYANRVYGHWATGSDHRVWLAYWFFYFYNDYNLLGHLLPAGLHEGDWEMIQLRLDPDGQTPDLALYSWHKGANARPWNQVERVGKQPVVYPARGSHACYFAPGPHWTGVWWDHANGHRPAPPLTLEVIDDHDPAYQWATWPGLWGDTEPQAEPPPVSWLSDSSPRGPGGHSQWHDPHALLEKATDHAKLEVPPPDPKALPAAPEITVTRDGRQLRIDYKVGEEPAMLIVTVNSPQEPLPPATHKLPVSSARGTVEVPANLQADWSYDIHASIATPDGRASPSTEVLLPARPVSPSAHQA